MEYIHVKPGFRCANLCSVEKGGGIMRNSYTDQVSSVMNRERRYLCVGVGRGWMGGVPLLIFFFNASVLSSTL